MRYAGSTRKRVSAFRNQIDGMAVAQLNVVREG